MNMTKKSWKSSFKGGMKSPALKKTVKTLDNINRGVSPRPTSSNSHKSKESKVSTKTGIESSYSGRKISALYLMQETDKFSATAGSKDKKARTFSMMGASMGSKMRRGMLNAQESELNEYIPVEVELQIEGPEQTEEDREHEAKVVSLKDEIRKRTIHAEIFARKESKVDKKAMLMRLASMHDVVNCVIPGVTTNDNGQPIEIQ